MLRHMGKIFGSEREDLLAYVIGDELLAKISPQIHDVTPDLRSLSLNASRKGECGYRRGFAVALRLSVPQFGIENSIR